MDGAPVARRQTADPADFFITNGIYFCLRHPHMLMMANWQKSFKREPPKTKDELRQMLAEAVRNTQPGASQGPKRVPPVKTSAADPACVD